MVNRAPRPRHVRLLRSDHQPALLVGLGEQRHPGLLPQRAGGPVRSRALPVRPGWCGTAAAARRRLWWRRPSTGAVPGGPAGGPFHLRLAARCPARRPPRRGPGLGSAPVIRSMLAGKVGAPLPSSSVQMTRIIEVGAGHLEPRAHDGLPVVLGDRGERTCRGRAPGCRTREQRLAGGDLGGDQHPQQALADALVTDQQVTPRPAVTGSSQASAAVWPASGRWPSTPPWRPGGGLAALGSHRPAGDRRW